MFYIDQHALQIVSGLMMPLTAVMTAGMIFGIVVESLNPRWLILPSIILILSLLGTIVRW